MPFIVQWPRTVKAGQVNDWLINNADFAPTILELAGVETPEHMQGRSFANALRGEPKPDDWRKHTYFRCWMHMAHSLAVPARFGIRSDRYKLIFSTVWMIMAGRKRLRPHGNFMTSKPIPMK